MKRYDTALPDLRYARSFVAVVRTGSFSKAAHRLFLTQPGVTTHVKKLERHLGYRLLERYPRKLVLTVAGERFYRFVEDLFRQMENVLRDIDDDRGQLRGWLRMAAPGSVAGYLLRRLPVFREQHHELRCSLQYQANDTILRALADGELDVGFLTEASDDTRVIQEPLFEDAIIVIRAKQRGTPKPLAHAAIVECPFIDYPDRPALLSHWLQHHYGKRVNTQHKAFSYFVNNLEAVIQLTAMGEGYAVLPQTALVDHALRQRVEIVRTAKATPPVQTVFWTLRTQQYLPKRLDVLRKFLRTAAKTARVADR